MASSTLRSGTEAEAGGGVLPIDVIYEILIRLPAEELCRLRVVCQHWQSLLSDSHFIAAHASYHRHRRPLIVAGYGQSYRYGSILCCIKDLSGRVVKWILTKGDEWLLSTHCNLACVGVGTPKQSRLINLVTEERFPLPTGLSREHTHLRLDFLKYYRISVALGQVPSTGEFKVLRVIDNNFGTVPCKQICEVLTHVGSRGARWRGKKAAQDHGVDMSPMSRVVIDGVVYFLLNEYVPDVRPNGIASFDPLTEECRSILRGPATILAKNSDGNLSLRGQYGSLSLAALNGSLVLVHCSPSASMDLWFLMDFEKGLWVKQKHQFGCPC